MSTLDELPLGRRARVTGVSGEDDVCLRLQEMGLLPDAEVVLVRRAPFGDPLEVKVMGTHLLLRASEARQVTVQGLA